MSIQKILVKNIFFFGPTGMFYIYFLNTGSLRIFYIFCALYILYSLFIYKKVYKKIFILGSLLFLITLLSALVAVYNFDMIYGMAKNPLVRFIIISILFYSFYTIFVKYLSNKSSNYMYNLYLLSFKGFLITFILGFLLYVLFLKGMITQDFYVQFVTVPQEAYGFTRFSPGTYPNEFGDLCSFFSIFAILLFILEKKKIYIVFSLLFILGIMLASTRIAYITFILSYLWLYISFGQNAKYISLSIFLFFIFFISIIALKQFFEFDFIGIFLRGMRSIIENNGSSQTRLEDLKLAINAISQNPLLGLGFEAKSISTLHNLPVQILFGYGFVLIIPVLFIFSSFFYYVNKKSKFCIFNNTMNKNLKHKIFFKNILVVLVIHVVMFGLTNHNQVHYLTWLLFGQVLVYSRYKKMNVVTYMGERY